MPGRQPGVDLRLGQDMQTGELLRRQAQDGAKEEADVLQGAPELGRRGGGCVGARREIRPEIDDRDHDDEIAPSDGFDKGRRSAC
jgi:hypothetical protein